MADRAVVEDEFVVGEVEVPMKVVRLDAGGLLDMAIGVEVVVVAFDVGGDEDNNGLDEDVVGTACRGEFVSLDVVDYELEDDIALALVREDVAEMDAASYVAVDDETAGLAANVAVVDEVVDELDTLGAQLVEDELADELEDVVPLVVAHLGVYGLLNMAIDVVVEAAFVVDEGVDNNVKDADVADTACMDEFASLDAMAADAVDYELADDTASASADVVAEVASVVLAVDVAVVGAPFEVVVGQLVVVVAVVVEPADNDWVVVDVDAAEMDETLSVLILLML